MAGIDAGFLNLYLQFFGEMDPKGTAAIHVFPERNDEFAGHRILFHAQKNILHPVVICFADLLKTRGRALEILRAGHIPYNLSDFLQLFPICDLRFFHVIHAVMCSGNHTGFQVHLFIRTGIIRRLGQFTQDLAGHAIFSLFAPSLVDIAIAESPPQKPAQVSGIELPCRALLLEFSWAFLDNPTGFFPFIGCASLEQEKNLTFYLGRDFSQTLFVAVYGLDGFSQQLCHLFLGFPQLQSNR